MSDTTGTDPIDDLKAWLASTWSPDLSVGEWWEKLGTEGWSSPSLPTSAYGRGLSRSDAVRAQRTIAEHGALGAPGGLGLLLAAPTIALHGSPEQVERFVKPIVTGQRAWCQLFSEPGAGSDLAGLQCKAEKDGEQWVVNGQKVWTSSGQWADMGMLIARTNPDAPKHQGITWFAFDMHQSGVDVRPLKEMTGRALFNEVFLSDATVGDDAIIGGLHNGWAVANATLMFERAGLGAGGGSEAGGSAIPGTIAGHLDQRAGDFVSGAAGRGGGGALGGTNARGLAELARALGKIDDPILRQDLVRLHTIQELGRIAGLRAKAGANIPGLPNIAKLSMSDVMRLTRDITLRILGPLGTLHAYDEEGAKRLAEITGMKQLTRLTEMALFAQAPPIYGGTDQVQRNIIGERVLGLPKEPGDEKGKPFRDLLKN